LLNTLIYLLVKKSAEAKSSTATEPAAAVAVSDNRLGRMGMAVLDSDDESLAEFMGQVSSQKQQHGPSAALQVRSVFHSFYFIIAIPDTVVSSYKVEVLGKGVTKLIETW